MGDPASISAFVASWFTPSPLFLFVNLVIGIIAITSRFAATRKPQHDASPLPHLVRNSSSLVERFRSFHFTHYDKHDTVFPETEYLQPQLVRTPSLLERLRSFNFGLYNNYEPNAAEIESVTVRPDEPSESEHQGEPTESQLARTPSLLERLKSMNFSSLYRSESIKAERDDEADAPEAKSDRDSGNLVRRSKSETPARFPGKMRKSTSEKTASRRWEEEEEEEARVERRRPETARGEIRNEEGEGSGTASFGEDEAVDSKADDFINKFKQQLRLQRLDSMLRYREMLRGN